MGSHHSPTIDLLGSYFPAWMVCIVSGLTLTLIAHWIVQFRNLKAYLGPAPLIYSCLMIVFTFATWRPTCAVTHRTRAAMALKSPMNRAITTAAVRVLPIG